MTKELVKMIMAKIAEYGEIQAKMAYFPTDEHPDFEKYQNRANELWNLIQNLLTEL